MKKILQLLVLLTSHYFTAQIHGNVAQKYGSYPGFNNSVNAIAIQADGKILVGGLFTTYKNLTEIRIIRLNTDGTKDTSFSTSTLLNINVNTIAIQSDGKILVGGGFQNKIIRLNTDGSTDSSFDVGTGFDSDVYTIAIQPDGKILAGGHFVGYKGVAESRIIRLNTDGTKDTSFTTGSGFDNDVRSISLQADGKIIIGGLFQSYNSTLNDRIVRLNTDGTKDTSFNIGTGFSSTVTSTAIQSDGKILVGGVFQSYNGVTENRIVRLNTDGTKDTTFNTGTGFDSVVNTLAVQSDGKVLVGGYFANYKGVAAKRIIRLNTDGTTDTSFNPTPGVADVPFGQYVSTIAIQTDGKILLGGNLLYYNNLLQNSIIRLNTDATKDTTFNSGVGFNEKVLCSAVQSDGKILLGGFFKYKESIANRIIRLNTNGTIDTTFNTGSGFTDNNSVVRSIAIQSDGKILVGGAFGTYNGASGKISIIRLNTDGTIDTSFNTGTGFNGLVYTLAIQSDGKILVGGTFSTYNGVAQNFIIRLNTDGTKDTTFNTGNGFDSHINSIVLQPDGKILVGGDYFRYDLNLNNFLIRLNTNGSKDNSFDVGTKFSHSVRSIAVQTDGKILVGGDFITFDGQAQNKLIRLNTDGTKDTAFNIGSGFNNSVLSIAVQNDGKIHVGGVFTAYKAVTENGIIRLNADGTKDINFNTGTGFNGTVRTITMQPDGKIHVGGDFITYKDDGESAYLITLYSGDNSVAVNTSITHVNCYGTATGSATITPISGTAPYTYVWTSAVPGFVAPATSSNSITNALAGTYTCLVTDSSTPTVREKTVIITITQPEAYNAYVRADAHNCGSYGVTIDPLPYILKSNDFSTTTGFTLSGDATYSSANGNVQLIPDANSKTGSMIIDLPTTIPSDFVTKFRFKMLNKSGADGFSFNIGNDSFPGAAEDGSNQGLAIKFKNYNNDRVSAAWNGTLIGTEVDIPLETGNWIDVVVKVINGKLSLYVNNNVLKDNETITGYTINNAYKAIFKGRTGGASNEVLIDDFSFANPTFEYSIDGTTFQTSNVFTNITLPTNNILPIWLKQNGCASKVRDFTYPKNQLINSYTFATTGCAPTTLNLTNAKYPIVYYNDFSTLDGYILGKVAKRGTNSVLLTDDYKGSRGYMVINKPEAINKDFAILFDHKSLNKSGADGFSVNFGNPTPIYNSTVDYENGVTSGLSVRFKTWGQDTISIFYNGTQVGSSVNTSLETGNITSFIIKVKNNQISVENSLGSVIITPQNLPAAFTSDDFSNYKFIFSARTGGESNIFEISNVYIAKLDVVQYSINNNNTFTDITPDTSGNANLPIVPTDYTNGSLNVHLKFKNDTCPIANSPINVTAKRNPINTIVQNAGVLTSDEDRAGATYEWYTCTSGAGTLVATTRSYTPTIGGQGYFVKVKLDNCESNSACVISTLSTNDFDLNTKLSIYPNPSNSIFNIDIDANASIELYDIVGKKLKSDKIVTGTSQLDLSNFGSGIYLLKVTNESNQTKTVRLIKE